MTQALALAAGIAALFPSAAAPPGDGWTPTDARPPIALAAESIDDFATAYRAAFGNALDCAHRDPAKYHAYRYLTRRAWFVGFAVSFAADSAGHTELFGEPHTSSKVGVDKTLGRASHVMLPIGTEPRTSDAPCPAEPDEAGTRAFMGAEICAAPPKQAPLPEPAT